MRRLLCTAAVLACALVPAVGCGGDDSPGGGLESALSYMPADTPFAVAIDTDLDGGQLESLDELLGRFPGTDSLEGMLRDALEQSDEQLSFDDDLKPLLGNPFVVSATDVASFLADSDTSFVAAIQAKDTDAIDRVIDKTKPDEQGEVAGATVYEDDGTSFAVEDDMVVLADSRRQLEAALERADGDDHLTEASFEKSLDGLPERALARVYTDVQALIEQDPDAQTAREVEWVAALRTLGLTASVEDGRAEIDFNLRTEGDLSDADLPLAAGDESPRVVRQAGEIGLGIRDPSQLVTFFEGAFQALEPQDFGDYEAGKRALSQQLDIDVDRDLLGQLTGDLSISVAPNGAFAARAEVGDAQAFRGTLDKLAEALPQLGAGVGVDDVARRGDLYEARLASGGRLVFGMAGDAFVAASDVARARRIGSDEPQAVDGANGSLVVTADAERLVGQLLPLLGADLGPGGLGGALVARPLDELSGSVSTSTEGMTGKLSLSLD